ncbi:MAG TPA: zf-HC2 domain-containing protein [Xanthomonadales bacterium]|nr:zf-HC2 domain-containing protein [Xanthomonadales bacterium]
MNHLDDDAELYALGLTDRERDAEIEAHLATCDACRARVVAAESVAASLAAALPPMPAAVPRRAWWTTAATAAAVVFAATTAFASVSAHTVSVQLAQTDTALGAIASSHFGHTTLTSRSGVIAKALYARDGAWLYIVAENAPRGARVLLRNGSAMHDVGELGAGTPATLFVRAPGHAAEINVVAGDVVVAHGAPAY